MRQYKTLFCKNEFHLINCRLQARTARTKTVTSSTTYIKGFQFKVENKKILSHVKMIKFLQKS